MIFKRVLMAVLLGWILLVTGNGQAAQSALTYHKIIDRYYETRAINGLWTDPNGNPRPHSFTLLNHLEQSWQHGLNPANYHLNMIKSYLEEPDQIQTRDFDRRMSDAFLQYARDLSGMRVDPDTINQSPHYWQDVPAPDLLLRRLQTTPRLDRYLADLSPQGPLYRRLQQELINLLKAGEPIQQKNNLVLTSQKILAPGDVDQNFVPALRQFFNMPAEGWNAHIYDELLAQEIIRFQKKHHVRADGLIGPQTLDLLNKTPIKKIKQIMINMERLRWLSPERPNKYILVNIPSTTLWAVENNQIRHQMPVIIGRRNRPTKSFITEITGVRFNPTWTVPSTIKKQDFLPQLQEDPLALTEKGIEIVQRADHGWMSIDPVSINWNELANKELQKLKMVQQPGPKNPLGLIRILMPNKYNIYLHDTTTPEDFQGSGRMLSSGCVRMFEPEKIAAFILSENDNFHAGYIREKIAAQKMADVQAANKIPVYLLYLSIWLNDNGTLTFGPDIYGWDKQLLNALNNHNMIPHLKQHKKNGIALASSKETF